MWQASRITLVGFVLATTVATTGAWAEPSRATRFLMGENVTLMDWGLYRIEQALDLGPLVWGGLEGQLSANASFDWDRNRILVDASFATQSRPTIGYTRIACREGMQAVRKMLGMDVTTGAPKPGEWNMGSYFLPKAFALESAPKNLDGQILELTEISLKIWALRAEGTAMHAASQCNGRLLGTDVRFAP